MPVDDIDQLAQDGEFKLELDAVDQGFECGLEGVQICVLQADEGEVHDDDDGVDTPRPDSW